MLQQKIFYLLYKQVAQRAANDFNVTAGADFINSARDF